MPGAPLLKISVRVAARYESETALILEAFFGLPTAIETKAGRLDSLVSVYLSEASAWTASRRRTLLSRLKNHGEITSRRLAAENWAESWKRHFKPMEVGSRLLIKPSWSKRRPRKGQAVVVLDPGLSFGTGQHHTTRFCLEKLAALRTPDTPQSLLDAGTGSGILAIAGARLGYSTVTAIDHDPDAVRIAKENANRNRAKVKIRCQELSAIQTDKRFDVVCANLTAEALLAHNEALTQLLNPGGHLVLAGILRSQFAEVSKAFRGAGLRVMDTQSDKTWKSALVQKKRAGFY